MQKSKVISTPKFWAQNWILQNRNSFPKTTILGIEMHFEFCNFMPSAAELGMDFANAVSKSKPTFGSWFGTNTNFGFAVDQTKSEYVRLALYSATPKPNSHPALLQAQTRNLRNQISVSLSAMRKHKPRLALRQQATLRHARELTRNARHAKREQARVWTVWLTLGLHSNVLYWSLHTKFPNKDTNVFEISYQLSKSSSMFTAFSIFQSSSSSEIITILVFEWHVHVIGTTPLVKSRRSLFQLCYQQWKMSNWSM